MKNTGLQIIAKLFIILYLTHSYAIADNAPAVDFENIMNSKFYETGTISFGDYRIAFAPEPPFSGYVAVVDTDGKVIGQHGFYEDYANKEGVFATIRAKGPADVNLTAPGIYVIVFVINDVPATRFPIKLEQTSKGDDAFNPQIKFQFDGFWRTMAHITMRTWKGEPVPELTMWTGGKDLAEGATRDGYLAKLLRNGSVVAHSKKNTSIIASGHYKRNFVTLYHPHTEREEPNARPFMLADWQIDGKYEISVTRNSDGNKIRSYDFDVVGGKIQGIERSQLGYEPAVDFVMPRVINKSATSLEMIEAIWIDDHR